MKVLVIHNYYQQPGGEDNVFEAEKQLLREHGHDVIEYTAHNDQVETMSTRQLALNTIWSKNSFKNMDQLLRKHQPDVAHFHNTFMMISPSAYWACWKNHVPVVQTLHNYRLLCLNAQLHRESKVCDTCLTSSIKWRGILHRCYRDNGPASSVVAAMLFIHKLVRTWDKVVTRYIVLSDFARGQFIKAGFPQERLMVKSNFIQHDAGMKTTPGCFALFVGRLTEEKGVLTMLNAWRSLPDVPLKIIGDGPLKPELEMLIDKYHMTQVELLGYKKQSEVAEMMQQARYLVFPSTWYEGMPLVLLEAMSSGLPVITSDTGSQGSMITHCETGLHFKTGDAADLARQVRYLEENPALLERMSCSARQEFEMNYVREQNYMRLMNIYQEAIRAATDTQTAAV